MSDRVSVDGALSVAVSDFTRRRSQRGDNREWIGNYDTYDKLLNRLFYPVYEDNIEFISVLIDGSPGAGKTKKAGRICEDLITLITEAGHTYNIIPIENVLQAQDYYEPTDYNIVTIDDAIEYNEKLAKKAQGDFNRVRHVFSDVTGRKSGVIIFLWTVQDGFRLEKLIRKQLRAYIFNSCPSDKSDNDFINAFTCYKGMGLLRMWETKLHDEHKIQFKGRCVISTPSWAGWCDIPLPVTEFFSNLKDHIIRYKSEDQVVQTEWKHLSGDVIFKEKERFKNLSLIAYGLENWETIYDQYKWPEVQKLKDHQVKAFSDRIIGGLTLQNIADDYNVTRQTLGNSYKYGGWFAIVREEMIGHLLEHLLIQEGSRYAGYKIIAGTGRVDLLSPDKKKAIEVKCRSQYDTPNIKMLSNEMKEMIEEESAECYLCLCILKKGQALFIIYQISKNVPSDKRKEIEGFA